mgnify:CR=1 FL=1
MASRCRRPHRRSHAPTPGRAATSAFLFRAWNASVTVLIKAFSSVVSSKSPSRARSRNSPELRPIVMMPRSVSFASRAISPAATAISGSGAGSMKGCVGGRFFVRGLMAGAAIRSTRHFGRNSWDFGELRAERVNDRCFCPRFIHPIGI